jgi:predicted nucleotidyltransferase component of viral defense system
MIPKQEILERASEWNLRPDVVEKDYVLGWLLAAISQHGGVQAEWVLKGGTCIKKCFFETYRFSEDLDFSLSPTAPYDEAHLVKLLREIADSTGNLSGIRFNSDEILVKERHDKAGRVTFEGRIGYQGPMAMPSWPRIRFDITRHEPVLLPPVNRGVLHPYTDRLPEGTSVRTYAFEELLAEKARALYERTRPRDLYDVAYVLDNLEDPLDTALVRDTFFKKCRSKEFEPPTAVQILERVRGSEELRADWDAMLTHQLPYAAPAEGAIERLDRALAWLVQQVPPQMLGTSARLPTAPTAAAGGAIAPRDMRGGTLELLRFAGANRLLVAFNYNSKPRIIEPYSLRWAKTTGNLLFYGWELSTGQIKCFIVPKMSQVRVLDRTFAPRYHVELGIPGTIARGPWRW